MGFAYSTLSPGKSPTHAVSSRATIRAPSVFGEALLAYISIASRRAVLPELFRPTKRLTRPRGANSSWSKRRKPLTMNVSNMRGPPTYKVTGKRTSIKFDGKNPWLFNPEDFLVPNYRTPARHKQLKFPWLCGFKRSWRVGAGRPISSRRSTVGPGSASTRSARPGAWTSWSGPVWSPSAGRQAGPRVLQS